MKILLNDGWSFLKLHTGSTFTEAQSSSGWKTVDLPHDWLIWQSRDLYESADAWYRREIIYDSIPETCILHFDGVYMDCEILLNGEIAGSHAYGYTAFFADLTGKIRPGRNEIYVHIRHLSPNTRWYSGSGIFRDVHLLELPADYIVPDSFYFSESESDGIWNLSVSAETSGTDQILFLCDIFDPSGKKAGHAQTVSLEHHISLDLQLRDAEIWDVDHPALYVLRYSYGEEQGEIAFGLRSIRFSPEHGFFLNNRNLKLKGVCLHHDLGALGSAFHRKAARRQLLLMKEMGANAVRTSHNPPASGFLDLCDELGLLVIDEAFDMWERPKTTYDYARFFPSCEEEDVALWIRRDRCHPSVIMWSVGNEIYDMHADERGSEICRMLMNQVRTHDPAEHAAVTFGCNYMPWEGGQRCADIVKIAGYNYGEKLYAEHHLKHPDWVIYGSETASVLSSRGIYHFPIEKSIMSEADLQCSALGNSNTSWGATNLRRMIVDDLNCPYSLGQFIWSGIDYIGEPTPYHTRSCYFGQADTACFPKDAFYLFKSLWSAKAVLHIGVYWDWNPGQLIDVPVMSSYRRVELLLNGNSLGIREVIPEDAERCLPVWKVPYEAGEICARALDNAGNILAETFRRTPGETAALSLASEDDVLLSDGHDLAFVTVQALDAGGNPVDNARDRVSVYVTGGGRLAGTDNGDSTDPDGYKQSCRRLFNGKLLLIVASNGEPKDTVIRVVSTSGIKSEICIPSRKVPRIPGYSCNDRIPDISADNTIPIRKIEIIPCGTRELSAENPSCTFRWRILPPDASVRPITWEITNNAGIVTPFADTVLEGTNVHVTVRGDGLFYLRALGGSNPDHPEIISQTEITACGIGKPPLDPYQFICAGLYDLHEGDIGTGNEKGIAFAREGVSMAGFSNLDFGKAGSDTIILPVFALDNHRYEIEMLDGEPGAGQKLLAVLTYEKPSIWNVYQEETYRLPERLTGLHTICFRMRDKVHLKGFRFEKQSRAFRRQNAGEADTIYGDVFRTDGKTVREIGNNVSLQFDEMDFGNLRECDLVIRGKTDLNINSITIRFRNGNNESTDEVADFLGEGGEEQKFRVRVPGGMCMTTFVFLPGSHFDFESFYFLAP